MTLHDERGKVISKCSWTYAFVPDCLKRGGRFNQMLLRNMTLHDDRGGFNQMLLDLCFSMRPQDDTA